MTGKSFSIPLFLGLLFLVFSCTPGPITPEKAPSTAVTFSNEAQAPPRPTWELEWEKILKAAQKEGRVVIYTSEGAEPRAAMTTAFKKKYGIEVETMTARSLQLIEKMFTERKAGLNLVDMFISGSTDMILRLKPSGVLDPPESELILPELTDPRMVEKLWYDGKIAFVDRETRLILTFSAYTTVPFASNTDLVKPTEIKSYKDLLQPKWKGKISINDPTMPGAGGKWFGMSLWAKMADLDFMRALAQQEPVILTDTRLQVDWLSQGKYPLAIAAKTGVFTDFVAAGAPVQRLPAPVEGAYLSSGGGNVVLVKGRPHPNAARLYLNWLLTQEGQRVFSMASGRQSRRLDVPTDYSDPTQRIEPGVKYANGDDEEYLRLEGKYYEIAKEIFGKYIRG